GYIEFLPALPQQWNTGHVKGLCVRGGAETELEWKNGKLTRAVLKATTDGVFRVKMPQSETPQAYLNGKKQPATGNGVIAVSPGKGGTWEIRY
ncbi:MAG: glycoside hydrolase family 95 protein, partial [Bacteroidales bacterium]|nr:glycoside hydrolase family 95 protein [Bacteroidales bacterium]